MRYFLLSLLILPALAAQSKDETDAVAVIEKTFRGMAAHDGDMVRSTMLPDARLYATRDNDGTVSSRPLEDFVKQIATSKTELLERFTAAPRVTVRGNMAEVWGEYDFRRDGKFSHCGVDTAVLFKTKEGWKIASLSYTVETTGCNKPAKN